GGCGGHRMVADCANALGCLRIIEAPATAAAARFTAAAISHGLLFSLTCHDRPRAWASNDPWVPKARPPGPSAGSKRLAGRSGETGSAVCCELYPVLAR